MLDNHTVNNKYNGTSYKKGVNTTDKRGMLGSSEGEVADNHVLRKRRTNRFSQQSRTSTLRDSRHNEKHDDDKRMKKFLRTYAKDYAKNNTDDPSQKWVKDYYSRKELQDIASAQGKSGVNSI